MLQYAIEFHMKCKTHRANTMHVQVNVHLYIVMTESPLTKLKSKSSSRDLILKMCEKLNRNKSTTL